MTNKIYLYLVALISLLSLSSCSDQSSSKPEAFNGTKPVTCPDGGSVVEESLPEGNGRGCKKVSKDRRLVKHGPWTEWYINGAKQKEGSYSEDRRHGRWTWWHVNGKKMQEGSFSHGEAVGYWSFWDEKGNKIEGKALGEPAEEGSKASMESFSRSLKKNFDSK